MIWKSYWDVYYDDDVAATTIVLAKQYNIHPNAAAFFENTRQIYCCKPRYNWIPNILSIGILLF